LKTIKVLVIPLESLFLSLSKILFSARISLVNTSCIKIHSPCQKGKLYSRELYSPSSFLKNQILEREFGRDAFASRAGKSNRKWSFLTFIHTSNMPIHSLVDLSHTLTHSTQIYPGDPPFISCPFATIATSGYNAHKISLGSHTGTHLDAPFHFFEDGKMVDQIPLDMLIGKIVVVDLTTKLKADQRILWDDLKEWESQMGEGVIVLLYTGWSEYWCTQEYFHHPFLDRGAAERIMNTGVRVLGIDTLSPDQTHVDDGKERIEGPGDFGVHEVVLGRGGVIIENLTNLGAVAKGGGGFVGSFVPLSIGGCDGAPVRAFAWKEA
jgi:kynurenine formamidase